MSAARDGSASISIIGDIGGFGISFADFKKSLDSIGQPKTLNISLNSDGGDVYTGFAIYNALMRVNAHKIVTVEGLAASMGSVVAMAGDERIMPKNAVMMVHNPVGSISGQGKEIVRFGESVARMRDNIATAYADATLLPMDEITRLMDEQTWLDAKTALALGFATAIEEPHKIAAYFDLSRYRNAPKNYGAKSGVKNMSKTRTRAAADDFEGDEMTADEIRASERTAVLENQRSVSALCKLAGKPELAAGFNEKGMSADDVKAELLALAEEAAAGGDGKGGFDLTTARGRAAAKAAKAAAAKGGTEVNARNSGMHGQGEDAPVIDSAAIYARYNKRKAVA